MALDSAPNHASDPSPDASATVVYPDCDDMGETAYHSFACHLLIDLLDSYFAAHGRPVFVHGNQFFYYKKGDPRAVMAPDVYTVDDVTLHPTEVRSWKTWEQDGKPPTLVVEIVSEEYGKDYSDAIIERYQQLGARELVRFDPNHGGRSRREPLAHFVRNERGLLERRPVFGDRVRLVSYDLWLVARAQTLRLAVGDAASLWPTASERVATAEAARAEAEAARAEAEAELARLRALLASRGE